MPRTINALDPSQRSILEKLTSDDVPNLSLVYGPPGTGKSHLIVSLLFELARKGNKVLFVSQNREALEVVVRKYHEIDKGMNLDDGDFRFLDLCLNLSDPSQRTLKSIKAQVTKLQNGMVSIPWKTVPSDDDNTPPYPIAYSGFGDLEELSVKKQIGLDELLASELEFVKHDKIIPNIINGAADINAREIYALLRNYKKRAENFRRYNSPNDELRFFNNKNLDLILGNVQLAANDIKQGLDSLPEIHKVSSSSTIDIDELIRMVALWCQGNEYFDIKKIYSEKVSVRDLEQKIFNVEKIYKKIPDCGDLSVPNEFKEKVFNSDSDRLFSGANDVEELEGLNKNAKKVLKIINEIESDVGDSHDIDVLAGSILRKLSFTFIEEFRIYKDYGSDELHSLCEYGKYWASISGIKKAFTEIPEIFNTLDKQLINGKICSNADYFETIANILSGTEMTYGDFRKSCKAAEKSDTEDIALRFGEERLVKILNNIFVLNELLSEIFPRDLLLDDISIKALKTIVKKQIAESDYVIKVAGAKSYSVPDAIKEIDGNIKKRNILSVISEIEKECSDYIKKRQGEMFADFCVRYTKDECINAEELDNSLAQFSDDIKLDTIKNQKILDVIKTILNVKEKQFFSPTFFEMKAGETIGLWLDRTQYVINYNNAEDFNNFVDHNRFIANIKKQLGTSNEKLIDGYIKMDLDFADFAEQIVFSLRCTIYNSLPPKWVKTIGKGYFDRYSKELEENRKKYYLHSIRDMAIKYEDPAKRLVYYANWRPANTTMGKIKANSEMIAEAFPVIIATPAEVAKYIAPKKELFDFVIFDEASQLLPGQAIPSIYRAKNAVIVGDPHQMPPISTVSIGAKQQGSLDDDDGDFDDDQVSILDVIKDMQINDAYHLKVHYRSKYNVLFEPSREAIYANDDIRPIVEAQSTSMPLFIEDNYGEDDERGFSAIVRKINSYISQNPKATFCVLFTRKSKSGENEFRAYLEEHSTEVKDIISKIDNEELLISTVTNCQGIMGDHTIMYIPWYKQPKKIFFFAERAGAYKRLNVSITRQAESLDIIMGNDKMTWVNTCQSLLSSQDTGPFARKSAELFQSLLANAGQEIDENYLEKTLGPNKDYIDSPLTQQLYDKLCAYYGDRLNNELKIWCEVGYKIRVPSKENIAQNDYNVGYRIDIGIYSMYTKRFILGIEMDGATYHSGFYKEFSDSQRQEILESKGWNIYRIWSTNWLHDMAGEFNALVNEINGILEKEKKEPIVERVVQEEEQSNTSVAPSVDPEAISGFVQGFINFKKKKQSQKPQVEETAVVSEEPRKPVERIIPNNPYSVVTFKKELTDYIKKSMKYGKAVQLKYADAMDGDKAKLAKTIPYQQMLVKTLTDEYIEASFDVKSSYYRINLDKIIAYIEE